jgi:hypothetical protein
VLGIVLAAPVTATLRLFLRYVRAKLLDRDFVTTPAYSTEQRAYVYRLIHFLLGKRFATLPPAAPGDFRASAPSDPAVSEPAEQTDVSGWSL